MTATIDRGAVSVVMATKSFFVTQDYLSDPRFAHSDALDRQFSAEQIMSLAGFPILSDGEVQGLLLVAERHARHEKDREVSVLGFFALHAGVAMRNAGNFAQLTQALAAAEHSRRSLEHHISRVEVSAYAHDQMMSLWPKAPTLHCSCGGWWRWSAFRSTMSMIPRPSGTRSSRPTATTGLWRS